jgi:hypothetical protein
MYGGSLSRVTANRVGLTLSKPAFHDPSSLGEHIKLPTFAGRERQLDQCGIESALHEPGFADLVKRNADGSDVVGEVEVLLWGWLEGSFRAACRGPEVPLDKCTALQTVRARRG